MGGQETESPGGQVTKMPGEQGSSDQVNRCQVVKWPACQKVIGPGGQKAKMAIKPVAQVASWPGGQEVRGPSRQKTRMRKARWPGC